MAPAASAEKTSLCHVVFSCIGGERLSIGPEVDSINPATNEIIGRYRDGGGEAAKAAIAAARSAFGNEDWKGDGVRRAAALSY